MQLKAILFDLDGTLLDSVSTILESNRVVCTSMGISYDEDVWRTLIGIPLEVQANKLLPGRELEYMDNYKRVYRERQDPEIRLFPGTVSMLDALRLQGYRTAVVTSKNARGTHRVMQLTELATKFDAIITADDVERAKPHPEPILKALDMLSVKSHEAIYVGDSFFDVDSSQRAKVDCVAVSWGARSKDELLLMCPKAVVDSWQEFLDWLTEGGC